MNYIFSNNINGYDPNFLSRNYIEQFCESLRRINFDGKLILFTESIDRLKPIVHGLNVNLIQIDTIVEDPSIFPILDNFDVLNVKRLYYYKQYINSTNINLDDNILFIDSRDVIFQTNPFDKTLSPNLTFSEEPLPFFNSWSSPQFEIYNQFDSDIFLRLKQNVGYTINSNFIGSIKNFIKLIDDITKEIKYIQSRIKECKTIISDQILINKLIYINQINYATVLPNENHLIVNNLIDGQYTYDGKNVYMCNKPVSIIHQYDRNPIMLEFFLKRYKSLL